MILRHYTLTLKNIWGGGIDDEHGLDCTVLPKGLQVLIFKEGSQVDEDLQRQNLPKQILTFTKDSHCNEI